MAVRDVATLARRASEGPRWRVGLRCCHPLSDLSCRRQDAMLFCSMQFLQFFLVIFTAYWLLRWRWGRAGILLTVGSVFIPTTWNYLCGQLGSAGSLPDLCDYVVVALSTKENPVFAGGIYWMAALVGASTVRALWGNHDRARVWLLLCASFFFYASWSKWLALVICVSTGMD